MDDFFLIYNDDFYYSDIIPNYKTIFLWMKPQEKKIRIYYPVETSNVLKLSVNRRVQSIIRSGYIHPSGMRVGLHFTLEDVVERYENFHEEKVKTVDSGNISPTQWLQIMEEKAKKLTGARIKELDMPVVDVVVKIYANTFEVIDRTTKNKLNKINFYDEAHLESGEMLGNQKGFKITTSLGETQQYKFDIFKPFSHLLTDALMLIKLKYDPVTNKGLYFGTFEIGEFSLNKATGELEIVAKYSNMTHAYSYLVTADNKLVIGFQSGHLQYINWLAGQSLIWESTGSAPASIHSLAQYDKYFIAGLNDGSIHLFNTLNGQFVKSFPLLELTIAHLEVANQFLYCADELGNNAKCFDLDREISVWEIPLKKGKIVSMDIDKGSTIIYTEKGYKFTIENDTGAVKEQNLGHKLTCKPEKLANWEILGSGSNLLYGMMISPTMDRHELEFTRISSIITLNDGLLVSTLEGKISFLKKVSMEKVQ